jgi:hypothetical protein
MAVSVTVQYDSATVSPAGEIIVTDDGDIRLDYNGNDQYTKFLCHCDGADGQTTFTDSSLEGAHAITQGGNAEIDTAQSVFGGASLLLDSSSWIQAPIDPDWYIGPSDWTIDFRLRFNGAPGNEDLFGMSEGGGANYKFISSYTAATSAFLGWRTGNVTFAWVAAGDTWYHFALVKSGSTYYMFIDGVLTGGSQAGINPLECVRHVLELGNITNDQNPNGINGWMDEIRWSDGIARWTSGFTVPTKAYGISTGGPTVTTQTINFGSAQTINYTDIKFALNELYGTYAAGDVQVKVYADNVATPNSFLDLAADGSNYQVDRAGTFSATTLKLEVKLNSDASENWEVSMPWVEGISLGGACDYPATTDVRNGVVYNNSGSTGVLVVPTTVQVLDGVGYGANATEYEGVLALPASASVVLDGETYGPNDSYVGTVTLPASADVRESTQYGAGGTQYTGTLTPIVLPFETVELDESYEIIEI